MKVIMVGRSKSIALTELRKEWGEVEVCDGLKIPLKKYDLVIAQEPTKRIGIPAYFHSIIFHELFICEAHGPYLQYLPTLDRMLAVALLKKAHLVRAVNREIVKQLKKIGVNNVLLIPSIYVKTDIFKPLGIDKDMSIIYAGRFTREKRFDFMLKVIKYVQEKMPNVILRLVGSGPEHLKIERYAKNIGVKIDIRRWVPHYKLVELYNRAVLSICTSLYEGGPRFLFESCACGTPFISTKTGLIYEVAKDGVHGFFAATPREMSNKILEFLNNPEKWKRMGEEARKLVIKNFEWNIAIKRYAESYIKFLREKK